MKHIFSSLLLLTILCGSNAFGQQYRVALGFDAGANVVSFYGNSMLDDGRKIAVKSYQGLSAQYNFNNSFSIHSGLAYEVKGHKREYYISYPSGVVVGPAFDISNYTYLTLPVLFRFTLPVLFRFTLPVLFRFTFGQEVRLFTNAGPFVGFALKQETIVKEPFEPSRTIENRGNTKPHDFGIAAGIGMAIPIRPDVDLCLEMRNSLGLYNISKVPVFNNGSIKTNSLSLLLGCAFKLGEVAAAGH